jgi:hypothetical protein
MQIVQRAEGKAQKVLKIQSVLNLEERNVTLQIIASEVI